MVKKIKIPTMRSREKMVGLLNFSKPSGMRWMKASPKRAPTARETKRKIYFLIKSSLMEIKKAPTSEIKLTTITLRIGRYVIMCFLILSFLPSFEHQH